MNDPIFNCSDTHENAHIFAQILVRPFLLHLHRAGFLRTMVIRIKGYINSKDSTSI